MVIQKYQRCPETWQLIKLRGGERKGEMQKGRRGEWHKGRRGVGERVMSVRDKGKRREEERRGYYKWYW